MLQLTKIHIKNFRSFRDASFELKDLQLLIGPNNSGKTNLLRVFEFLRMVNDIQESAKIDLEKIRFQHKEFQHDRKPLPDPIEVTIEFFHSFLKSFVYFKIELFHIDSNISNQFVGLSTRQLTKEEFLNFNLQDFKGRVTLFSEAFLTRMRTMKLRDDSLVSSDLEMFLNSSSETVNYLLSIKDGAINVTQLSPDRVNLGLFLNSYYGDYAVSSFAKTIIDIRIFFSKLIIYKPDTSFIKEPIGKFQADKSINGNCDNIASYLENLQSSDPDKFQLINKELSKSLSDFKGYNFETVDIFNNDRGSETVRYFRLKDKYGVNHLAEDISEGALYFLMLIAIINQKDIPPILMLEEPETDIHPRRISEIMEFIFILREQHPEISIILTTHHPYVVDHFSDMTDRVWIFDTEKGESTIKNLQHDVIEPSNEKIKAADMEPIDFSSSLGEHWALGFLGGVPKPVVRG